MVLRSERGQVKRTRESPVDDDFNSKINADDENTKTDSKERREGRIVGQRIHKKEVLPGTRIATHP